MKTLNCHDVLREIAKQMGSKISKCEHYDPNVCSYEPDPSNIGKIITISGQPFRSKTAYNLEGQKIRLFANEDFIEIQIPFESNIDRISINSPDEADFLALAGMVSVADRKYSIFTKKAVFTPQHTLLTRDIHFKEFIQAVHPAIQESIHFSLGDLKVYLRCPSKDRVLTVTNGAVKFLGGLIRREREIDLRDLPSQFNPLLFLVRAWGITDDVEREERRQDVPRAALQAIVEAVNPYLPAINSYLNSFGEHPLSDSATALGALAEFAVETDLYLKETRNKSLEP